MSKHDSVVPNTGTLTSKSEQKFLNNLNEAEQLLQLVVQGKQDQAKEIIKKNRNLLLIPATVSDLSRWEKFTMTAFQYALWALDWHMWKMIQPYLPLDQQIQQFKELTSKKNHTHSKQLDQLIYFLEAYTDNYNKGDPDRIDDGDPDRIRMAWKIVAIYQRSLPVHVVNQYCRTDRSFDPCPDFKESTLPRTITCTALEYNPETSDELIETIGDWYTLIRKNDAKNPKITFAFLRGASETAWSITNTLPNPLQLALDIEALKVLSAVCLQQLGQLSKHLQRSALIIDVLSFGLFAKPNVHLICDYADESHQENIQTILS
ncbi:MAG: hypothetical protein JSR33_02930 [Proteobacteria bacterium]|nr:hypothetical protein [Pseudomonadota bacterium]